MCRSSAHAVEIARAGAVAPLVDLLRLRLPWRGAAPEVGADGALCDVESVAASRGGAIYWRHLLPYDISHGRRRGAASEVGP